MVYLVYGSARRPVTCGRKARVSESVRIKIMRDLRARARLAPTAIALMDPAFLRRACKDLSAAPSDASDWPASQSEPRSWFDRAGTLLSSFRSWRAH